MFRFLHHVIRISDETSAAAIAFMTRNTSTVKDNVIIVNLGGGVQAMCQLLYERVSQEEVVEPDAAALRHVTHNHKYAQQAVDILLQSLFCQISLFSLEVSVIKYCLSLRRSLALSVICAHFFCVDATCVHSMCANLN